MVKKSDGFVIQVLAWSDVGLFYYKFVFLSRLLKSTATGLIFKRHYILYS